MEWVIAVTQVCEQLVLCEIGGGAARKAGVAVRAAVLEVVEGRNGAVTLPAALHKPRER